MPFLHSNEGNRHHHHRRGTESSSFGSFDLQQPDVVVGGGVGNNHYHNDDADGNDGLFGLEALHYRAASLQQYTAPATTTGGESPRMLRHLPPAGEGGVTARRAGTDRPPLSHYYGSEGSSLHNGGDRPMGLNSSGGGYATTNNNNNNTSMESNDLRGFGAIGQLRQNAIEFDPNRRRASSQDNSSHFFSAAAATVAPGNPFGYQQQDLSQKFGALPSLSSHLHQQQHHLKSGCSNTSSFADVDKPRHIRSVSQPGPQGMGGAVQQQQQQQYLDSRFYSGPNSYESSYSKKPLGAAATRSASLSHQNLNSSYGQQFSSKSGASMPNLAYQQSGGYNNSSGYPPIEHREALDFHLISGSQLSSSYMGGLTTTESYGSGPISISPGQSPHQSYYGTHSRQASDSATMMSTQSMPMGLARHMDDDHPLVGEHIEVPDHDDLHGLPSYFMQSGGAHPLLRGATHGHSMSLDAISYVDNRLLTGGGAAAPSPVPKVVYAVKFKRSQRNFVPGPRISRDLKIGTYVKVEADRGEDLGIVVGKLPAEKFSSLSSRVSFTAGMGPPPVGSPADLKRIIRLATHDEVTLLGLKREEEEELLKICRAKVRQRGLPMNVVDAEYQFDRHKLTFFFEAVGRVDFRELVRDLFSIYKTRIWMQQLDKNTSTSAQAIICPQTANMHIDYGTPIIAPPSEFADSIVFHGMSDMNRSN